MKNTFLYQYLVVVVLGGCKGGDLSGGIFGAGDIFLVTPCQRWWVQRRGGLVKCRLLVIWWSVGGLGAAVLDFDMVILVLIRGGGGLVRDTWEAIFMGSRGMRVFVC